MTYKLAKTSQDADQYFGAVSLLLDGTDLQDKSLDTKAIAVGGTAQVSTTQSKWNGSSLYFDGTSDYLTFSPGFTIGTGDFTVECWVYPISSNQKMEIWQNSNLIGGFYLSSYFNAVDAGPILNRTSPPGSGWSPLLIGNTTLTASAWSHIAWVRTSGTIKMYLNGAQESSTLSSSIDSSTMESIGAWSDGQYSLDGYISDLRVTKGVARYTANFTPPTQPFTPALKTGADQHFYNTSLLIHGDGTNGSTNIVDSSYDPKTITVNGDAQISTAQSKFGGSSLAFDGSGDYLALPVSNDFVFSTGDLTFELWLRPNAQAAATIYDSRPSGSNGAYFYVVLDSSNNVAIIINGSYVLTSSNSCATGQFTHVAVVRSSGTLRIFINGSQSGSVANTTNFLSSGIAPRIGATVNNTFYFNGYIDDLRITKGVARYIADFTPPTKAFPDY